MAPSSRTLLPALVMAISFPFAPAFVAATAADNISGTFERCAEVTEFVEPSAQSDGHLTLLGIGPGLDNPVDDALHHRFPFRSGLTLDEDLKSNMTGLAAVHGFTCMRMKAEWDADFQGVLTALAILPTKRACGVIEKDYDGTFLVHVEPESWEGRLIGDAKTLIDGDPYLANFLGLLAWIGPAPVSCITFGMNSIGRLATLTVDIRGFPCGDVRFEQDLRIGGFLIADTDSTSASLLPDRVRSALLLMVGSPRHACISIEVTASQWTAAAISLETDWETCGRVSQSPTGEIGIDELSIPATLLTSTQASQLASVVGGSACLAVEIDLNNYTGTIHSLVQSTPSTAPADTVIPSVEGNHTVAPSETASMPTAPMPSASSPASAPPLAPAAGTTDGGVPIDALLVLTTLLLAAGSAGAYVLYRRRGAAGKVQSPGDLSTPIELPPAASTTRAVGISLTTREREVIAMLLEGMSNKEIAARLFISESTAGVHVSNVMGKLGARSRGEAAALAQRMGLGPSQPLSH